MTVAVQVTDVHKSSGGTPVLRGIDLAVPKGSVPQETGFTRYVADTVLFLAGVR